MGQLGRIAEGLWADYVPVFTGFGTVTNITARYMKIGKTLFVQGSFTAGTTTATPGLISLPVNTTLSSSYSSNSGTPIGQLFVDASSSLFCNVLADANDTTVSIAYQDTGGASNALSAGNVTSWHAGTVDMAYSFVCEIK